MTAAHSLRLLCHPASSCPSIERVEVVLAATADGGLAFTYAVLADPKVLVIPPPRSDTALPVDGLWRHTCLEAFLMRAGGSAYREFNFSPSGQWAAYAFSAPRERDAAAETWRTPPAIVFTPRADGFTLRATLRASQLPGGRGGLRIGLSAVLETEPPASSAPRCSYWALHHPAPQPDFHDPAAFALTLD